MTSKRFKTKAAAPLKLNEGLVKRWESDLKKMTKIYRSIPTDIWMGDATDEAKEKALKTYLEAEKLFGTFVKNLTDMVYQQVLSKSAKGWAENQLRDKTSNLAYEMGAHLFPEEWNSNVNKHVPAPWKLKREGRNNIRRYQKAAREFFAAFREYIDYLERVGGPTSRRPREERTSVNGLPFVIHYWGEPEKGDDQKLKDFLHLVERYAQKLKRAGFHRPLKGLVTHVWPYEAPKGILTGGDYDRTKDVLNISPLAVAEGARGDGSTWIHEVGHRFYFRNLPMGAQKHWEDVVERNMTTVTEQSVHKWAYEAYPEIRKKDRDAGWREMPKLALQWAKQNGVDPETSAHLRYMADHHPTYANPEDFGAIYKHHKDKVGEKVALEHITDYGATNAWEAFAEAFKLYLDKGPAALGAWTRQFFEDISRTGGVKLRSSMDGIDTELVRVTKRYPTRGYEIRVEMWNLHGDDPSQAVEIRSAYSIPDGDYVGDPKVAYRLWKKYGINRWEKTDPTHAVCSIGYSPRMNRWFGWSHRACYGFRIGHVMKEGHIGTTGGEMGRGAFPPGHEIADLHESKKAASEYAKCVSRFVEARKVSAGASDLQRPGLQNIMKTLKRQPMDANTLKRATGMHIRDIKAYVTRLGFLGAVASKGGVYHLTEKGKEAIGASVVSAKSFVSMLPKGIETWSKPYDVPIALLDSIEIRQGAHPMRMQKVRDERKAGKVVPIEVDVYPSGKLDLNDGNHRLWEARDAKLDRVKVKFRRLGSANEWEVWDRARELRKVPSMPLKDDGRKYNDIIYKMMLTSGYVKLPKRIDGAGLRDVIKGWQERGDKVYDDSMPVMVPAKDLWKLREYTWTREKSRDGYAKVGNQSVHLSGPMKWDAILEDMKARGWDKKDPLWLEVGRRGGVKVGEGNHRLAIAMKVGLREVPVVIQFKSGKVVKERMPDEQPAPITKQAVKKAVEKQPEAEKKKLSPEEEKQIDDLINLLGF